MSVDDFVRARPGAALSGAVAWYSGYRQVDVAPATHRGLPSPYLTLIFTLDDPLVIAQHVDGSSPPSRYDALLGGLHTAPAIVVHDGRQSGIQVAVDPLASRALFGLPAGELAGLDAHAADVIGASRVEQVRASLFDGTSWPERLAGLEAQLWTLDATDCAVAADVPAEVRHAWRRLRHTGGRIPVSALAAETGWSARHLQSRFRIETGLTPKQAARVIRFDRARHALARHASARQQPQAGQPQAGQPQARQPRTSLAEVAACHGYADQAHLDREFRALAGCSPTTWLAEEFRNIQDGHWTRPQD